MSTEEASVVEKKKKNGGGNGKNGKIIGVSVEPAQVVVSPTPKKPPMDADHYIGYLERKVAELEWKVRHMEMESVTEREKSLIRKLQYYVRRIQNAPFDETARALLDSIRDESLKGVR
jgi:hypothetical protein